MSPMEVPASFGGQGGRSKSHRPELVNKDPSRLEIHFHN